MRIGFLVASVFVGLLMVVLALKALAASGGNNEMVPVNDETLFCREACGIGQGITGADYFGYDTANSCLRDCFVASSISSAKGTCNPDVKDNCCNLFATQRDPDCQEEPQVCTDSDGGKDYYVKGVTYGKHQWASDPGIGPEIKDWTDFCVNESNLLEFSCRTLTDPASEPIDVWSDTYLCPNGCFDGACQ
jgi:hypothetical protein